jgi:hypothetical protein
MRNIGDADADVDSLDKWIVFGRKQGRCHDPLARRTSLLAMTKDNNGLTPARTHLHSATALIVLSYALPAMSSVFSCLKPHENRLALPYEHVHL